MPVSVASSVSGPFIPNGATTKFPFAFKALAGDEVTVVDRFGEALPRALYSVAIDDDEGGTVSFSVAPALADYGELYILSTPDLTQSFDFSNTGPSFNPTSLTDAVDYATVRDLKQQREIDRSVKVPFGELGGVLPDAGTRAGLFLAFDANGDPIVSSGIGADAGLRGDLAADTGALLIGTSTGETVEERLQDIADGAQRLSYGARSTLNSWPDVLAEYELLHQDIVGFAADAGTTGGRDYDVYYVNNPVLDASVEYSFLWALDQVEAAGGGGIVFEPAGYYPIVIDERFTLRDSINNMTIWAPGRNVTFWSPRTNGIFNLFGQNHIYKNINHRPLPGPINLSAITNELKKGAKSLSQASTETCDRMAWIGCEFDHPSWHCLDMTRVTDVTGADPYRATVQNCIMRNAIQGHLIGTHNGVFAAEDPTKFTQDGSPRQCFVTFHECVWAYNLQRNPKVLGNAYVDVVDCVTILRPYENEYLSEGSDIEASAFGGAVQDGGWLRYRGSYIMSGDPEIDGRPATYLSSVPEWGGASGRISVEDSYAKNLVFETRDAALIDPLPYVLPHTNIAAMSDADREDWVAGIWAKAGARIDAAPEGVFTAADSIGIPNGQDRVIDGTDRTKQLVRVDQPYEYALPVSSQDKLFSTSRSYTRYVGYLEGKVAEGAIAATALDIAGLTTEFFVVSGNGAPADLKFITSSDGVVPDDGTHLYLRGQLGTAVTIKSASSIVATADPTTNTITIPAHGLETGIFGVSLTNSGGALPEGVVSGQKYWAIKVDANTIKLAATLDDAAAGTAVDLLTAGTGTTTALVGSFTLPGGTDLVLNDAATIQHFIYDTTLGTFKLVGSVTGTTSAGPYTPALVAVTNVTGTPTLDSAYYERNGGGCTVHVRFQATPTAAGTITVGIPFPVATTITSTNDVIGHGASSSGSGIPAYVFGSPPNNRAQLSLTAAGTATITVFASFRYPIK